MREVTRPSQNLIVYGMDRMMIEIALDWLTIKQYIKRTVFIMGINGEMVWRKELAENR
jgi:hypothetical protein